MKFRDDINPDNTWVVSDTHFGHDNIVRFCHRPGDPVREESNYGLLAHEEIMVSEWRKEVPDDATLLHLGDVCYRGNAVFKHLIAKELTGARKLLIRGNHDRNTRRFYSDAGFSLVSPFKIEFGGDNYVSPCGCGQFDVCDDCGRMPTEPWIVSFSHYAWNEREDGPMGDQDLRIHGHIHNSGYSRDRFVPFLRNHLNLSVEQTKYKPVNLGLLLRAVLLGDYPETTPEQLAEAAARKEANRA